MSPRPPLHHAQERSPESGGDAVISVVAGLCWGEKLTGSKRRSISSPLKYGGDAFGKAPAVDRQPGRRHHRLPRFHRSRSHSELGTQINIRATFTRAGGKTVNWYLKVLKQYADFQGRARRKEYWWFVLVNVLISMGLSLVDYMAGLGDPTTGYGLLTGLYSLAILVPGFAVSVRRLHDTGRRGWWLLLSLVPVIGPLVLLFFFLQDSEPGQNGYGPHPKEQAGPAEATATG